MSPDGHGDTSGGGAGALAQKGQHRTTRVERNEYQGLTRDFGISERAIRRRRTLAQVRLWIDCR